MKFDYCIGNPPYNAEPGKGDQKNFAPPVYHSFMDAAFTISDKVELIHPAKFLYNAGATPKAWNEKMLADKHFKILTYVSDSRTIFGSNVSISGGVAISYHNNNADYEPIGMFSSFEELERILAKVVRVPNYVSLNDIIYIQTRLSLVVLYRDHPEYEKKCGSDSRLERNIFEKIDCFTDYEKKDDIKILGICGRKRSWKFIQRKYIDESHENLYKYKVIVSTSNGGAGNLCDKPVLICGEPIISSPKEGYTRTFLGIGAFDSLEEAESLKKYVMTKFCRCMLGSLKATQLMNKDVWANVPMQDFSNQSDIDWSQSISDIDQQLYKKYNLSKDEIDFIESHVKEME